MSQDFVVNLGQQALVLTLLISGPILGLGLIIGLAVSIFQATTQIQEYTLTFIPKIIVVLIVLIIFGPWMLNMLIQFTQNLLIDLPKNI